MNIKKIIMLTFSLSVLLVSIEKALAESAIMNIRVGGTGCPSELTQIAMSPDQSSASIIFQQFESRVPNRESGPKVNPFISILNCNVFADVSVPVNSRLEALEISYDLRGHAFLDTGVTGNFKSFLISANGMGTERSRRTQLIAEKNWLSLVEEDFYIQTQQVMNLNGNCGIGSRSDTVTVHIQHQLASQIIRGYEHSGANGSITVDSSDIKGGIRLKAHVSQCRGQERPGNPNRRNCRVERVNGRAVMVCL